MTRRSLTYRYIEFLPFGLETKKEAAGPREAILAF